MKLVLLFTSIFIFSTIAFGETLFLPVSRDHKFLPYAFLTERHSSLLFRNGSRAWGSLGVGYALVENNEFWGRPQLIAMGSAHASFRINDKRDTLLTETIDARVGLHVNFEPSKTYWFSVGWNHQSGHISDNVSNSELIGPNLGNELVFIRNFFRPHEKLLYGFTFKPFLGSDPGMKFWASDEFVEVYPWGVFDSEKKLTPYFAAALEQYGANYVQLTTQIQAGVYLGNHLVDDPHPSMRLAMGYYNGVDPRMKYAQFKYERSEFVYGGILIGM